MEPHPGRAVAAGELALVLVLDPQAHVLEHREGVREVHRPPEVEELEAERARIGPGGPEEVRREGAAGRPAVPRRGARRRGRGRAAAPPAEPLDEPDVPERPVRAVAAPVARTEHRLVPAPEH